MEAVHLENQLAISLPTIIDCVPRQVRSSYQPILVPGHHSSKVEYLSVWALAQLKGSGSIEGTNVCNKSSCLLQARGQKLLAKLISTFCQLTVWFCKLRLKNWIVHSL